MRAVIEDITKNIDGVNRIFKVSGYFKPGSTNLFVNGNIVNQDDLIYGWIELGQKKIRVNVAPSAGYEVKIYYIPV